MKKHVKYSVLRYSPSAVAGERINLGMVVYDELLNISKFRYTKQFRRINSFDDEIDISAVKHILQDIKDEIEGTHPDAPMDIENFIRYYDNDFAFDSPKMIEYDDFDGKDLSKMINSAKVWAFNAMNTPDSDKLILMYRYSDKDEKSDPMFDSIMKIFKSSGVKLYDMDEGLQRINALS